MWFDTDFIEVMKQYGQLPPTTVKDLVAEKTALTAQHDDVLAEEKANWMAEKTALITKHNALAEEKNALTEENAALIKEKTDWKDEKTALLAKQA